MRPGASMRSSARTWRARRGPISSRRGAIPRDYAMVAFGGAGPAHAAQVARSLGVRTVIVPPASGAASALGFLGGRLGHEGVRSAPSLLSRVNWIDVATLLGEVEADGRLMLEAAGVARRDISVEREVELRLAGQVHNLRVALPGGALGQPDRGRASPTASPHNIASSTPASRRRRDRGHQLARETPRPRSRPRDRVTGPAIGRARCAQGRARPVVSRRPADRHARRSMTAMRWRPASRSPAPPSSRRTSPPPSCRRAIACASMTTAI